MSQNGLGKRKGPPTSDVGTIQGQMFAAHPFDLRNTRRALGDMGRDIRVPMGNRGLSLDGMTKGGVMVPDMRASSTAAIRAATSSNSYMNAVTQQGDPVFQPRVFYQFYIADQRVNDGKKDDFNTNGFLCFMCSSAGRPGLDDAAPGVSRIPNFMIRNALPFGAVEQFVAPTLNYLFSCETMQLNYDGPYPSPRHMMSQFRFVGSQNNQVDGQGANGSKSNFEGTSKVVNHIIFGDSTCKNVWGPDVKEGDSLYIVVTRKSRKDLEKKRLLEFVLNPNHCSVVRPGELMLHRDTSRTRARPQLVENPLHLCFMYSPNNRAPPLPPAYDDNGFLVEPNFIFVGRFSYNNTLPNTPFDLERVATNAAEYMKTGLCTIMQLPNYGLH